MRQMRFIAGFLLYFLVVASVVPAAVPELIPFRQGNAWGYCDPTGELRIAADYDAALPFQNGRAVVFRRGKAGLIDAQGQVIIALLYDNIIMDRHLRLRRGKRYALARTNGEMLTPFDYDQIFPERSGLFLVEDAGRFGMLDTAGQRVVPAQYDHVRVLRDRSGNYTDLIAVRDGEFIGLYDRCGNRISSPRYTRMDVFDNGFAVVQREYRFGMIDLEGREVIEAAYDNLHAVREGLAAAAVRGKWGFVDTQGREVVPFRFQAVKPSGFFQGRAAVQYRDQWLFIDRKGEASLPWKGPYFSFGRMSDGMIPAAVLDRGGRVRYGYLDHKGEGAIPFVYDQTFAFREGFAVVGQLSRLRNSVIERRRYGVLDRAGKVVVPLVLSSATEARIIRDSLASYGSAHFREGDKYCRVDHRGRISDCQLPAEQKLMLRYAQTRCERSPLVAVAVAGRWGFCQRNGREVIPPKYHEVACFENGLAMVWPREGEGYFFVDERGREYVGAE